MTMKTYHPWIILNSWKVMTMLISNIQLFCSTLRPNMWHPTPSSIFLHTCIEWCEWRFVGFHPSQCVCGHYVGCSQHPKIECPRLAKVDVKLTTPKGVFAPWIFLVQALEGGHILHGLSHESNNFLLVISSLNHMHITLNVCIHLKVVLATKLPLKSQRTTIFGFFYHNVVHLLEVFGEQPFQSICNGAHVDFAHTLQPHLNLIWIVLSYFSCFRGFICYLNCPLKQELKLKQKNY